METQDGTILAVQRRGREVAKLVVGLLAKLQFQDVTRQQVESVIKALTEFDSHNLELQQFLLGDADIDSPPQVKPLLDQMYGEYVMERQRAAHLGESGTATGVNIGLPMIELF
jgi:methyl-accepting chemotaxis protein